MTSKTEAHTCQMETAEFKAALANLKKTELLKDSV